MGSDELVYLLSLDGGGIRGISELIILHEIMKRLQKIAGLTELPKPKDYFHLIGGTSTGGLIAIMLGRMGMSTKEAIDYYMKFAKDVFSQRNRKIKRTYKAKTLEKRIQAIVAERKLVSTAMIDEGKEKGLVFVCSVTQDKKKEPYLFRTYKGTTNQAHNVEIWEAARATTAAPTFFKPISIKVEAASNIYVDGALAVNNPAKLVLKEAEAQLGTKRKLGFLLSLGTGLKANDKAVNVSPDAESAAQGSVQDSKPQKTYSGAMVSRASWSLLKYAKENLTDTEPTHYELNERFSGTPNAYFRFNLDQGASDIALDEYAKMDLLRIATERYLQKPDVSAEIDQVVSLLHNEDGAHMGLASTIRARSDESDKHAFNRVVQNRTDITSGQFTGREEILDKMEKYFFDCPAGSPSSRRLLRIWGMGGVGKTQIAVRFRDLHGSRFNHIFWINAATKDSIYESFRQVTETVIGGEHSRPDIKGVHKWMTQNSKWLLIFDNNDSVDVSKWIPPGNTGNILLTSRREDMQPRLNDDQTFAIDTMNENDAMELLLKSAHRNKKDLDDTDKWYASQIIEELECLPLALDQAGSYINLLDCPFSAYHFEFQQRRQELMQDSSLAPGAFEHNPAVYGTFELSYEALLHLSKDDNRKGRAALNALRVLNIFCFYHNENLTDEIFSRAATNRKLDKDVLGDMESQAPLALFNLGDDATWNSSNYSEGISLLRNYSLIKKSVVNEKWHSMHALVHSWARDRMRMDIFRFQQQAARSIIFDSYHQNFKFEDERFLAQILPHIKALVERRGSEDIDWFKKTRQDSKYARLLREVGMWREALWVLEQVVEERRENLEPEHWLVVAGLWDLANLHKTCCKFSDAEQVFLECIGLVERCSNKEWAKKAVKSISIDFAEVYIQQAQLGTAEQILNMVIEQEEERGDRSPQFRRAVAALAMTMQLAGRNEDAEKLEVRMLTMCSNDPNIGPGHRMTMSATSNIAALRSAKGEHESADEMWRQVLEVDERFRGNEHPITLQSKRNVAVGCVKLERLDEAEKILREVLDASDRVLWRTHLDTLVTIECLAGVLYQMDQSKEAEELQEECYEGRLDVLGEEHPLTFKAKGDLEKIRNGRALVAEEQVQVQWQGEAYSHTTDSNYATQGMNDRYLY
ncbi:protein kinase subdomain-containing protein [Colletotrichum truncatum]|uniref:Protein kinase subdomain-containing protein n=1 Tax=Colletotrichum truncatum TaxID=5467 RepID=A0ACC3Z473_COLTU|nr:protein kinase subdomain-containing protein [Colletotrichum truncatum]KAF6795756.1 protein kinase subdomain-containing protein [Colletotrichum truncatum]